MSTLTPAVQVTNMSKTFGGQKALDAVDLTVAPGEVHALLGENGSGKSTLIKILAGYHTPDLGGSVSVEGQPLELTSPAASHAAGLRFVHQRLAVIPEFNAVENMAMDLGYSRPSFIDWKAQARETRVLLRRLQVEMDIWKPLGECKPVERSAVAIARAIATHRGHVSTVVLDEPTSSLPEPEVEVLFGLIRELTSSGIAVIYVSHRLDEIFQIADRVSVLRDGRSQGTVERATLSRERLIEMIVGRNLSEQYEAPAPPETAATDADEVLLQVDNLSAGRIDALSFKLAAGEVLGFVGIAGSGREDVARALVGGILVAEGVVRVRGVVVNPLNAKRALAEGVVLGLSNTQTGSALRDFNVMENTTISSLRRYRSRFGPLRRARERRDTMGWIHDLDIRPTDPDRPYVLLSGGNQQKVILGRCLNAEPSVLVLDDPTAGVDVGARQALYGLIAREASQGRGVIICSNDLEDVTSTCHRAIILRHGRVVAEVTGDLDEHRLLSVAAHGTDESTPSANGQASDAGEPQINGGHTSS